MFVIKMVKTFAVGDTADVRINGKPARLTWRDTETLVINESDARRILHSHVDGEIRHFACDDGAKDKGGPRAVILERDDGRTVIKKL